ncbi:MAG TPA: FAD-linked oxidase C-terminal domain-containing protein [Chitinispirillaceae bacterium]|nr:FAD-linked oxidase C-terminal domain-containing protein [Chitinispirillaceae bacterium]
MRIITGKKAVLQTVPSILHDESQYRSGVPQKVFFPESCSDLQSILEEAHRNKIPVVFIGGQTGTTGGAVPDEDSFAVCFSAMNKIVYIKLDDDFPVLYCNPGVTLSSINKFLQAPQDWPGQVEGIQLLNKVGYMYPPDPTETTAQIGGTVATNASGARSFRFGSTRNFVTHLGCVLSTGDKLEIPRGKYLSQNNCFRVKTDHGKAIEIPAPKFDSPQLKNASGYFSRPSMDLIDLLIGSEGTLAAFYEIGIRLIPDAQIISGMSFFDNNQSAFDFADFLRQQSQVVSIEYFDSSSLRLLSENRDRLSENFPQYPSGKNFSVFWEFTDNNPESFESGLDIWEKQLIVCGSSLDHTWSGFDPKERELLRKFRHTIPELINSLITKHKINWPSIRKIGTDTAVPAQVFRSVYSDYIDTIKKRSLDYASFGHLGDYHLHINIIPSNDSQMTSALETFRELMYLTVKNRGTVSAEHGIGKIKKEYFQMMYDQQAISQMKAIKSAFDPSDILNCGNLF